MVLLIIVVLQLCVLIHGPIHVHCCEMISSVNNSRFTALLIFGDSTVDTGNNNYILTIAKGNHPPYGRDFPGNIPTGRFSNGKLVPDFIASSLRIMDTVPPFLDPSLSYMDLKRGVSFASGGSGYDDLTTVVSGAIPVSRQLGYFKEYIQMLKNAVGEKVAEKIIRGALVITSAGTNDLAFNFYDVPTRKLQFNIDEYTDFLQARILNFISELYNLGCRKIVVAGLPPVGCLPIQMTMRFAEIKARNKCVEDENLDAQLYNRKLEKLLSVKQEELPQSKIVYADVYEPLIDMIDHPRNYGFVETKKGCCGSGYVEAGPLCNGLTGTCKNASEYLFWDCIHLTESAYYYLSQYLEKRVLPQLSFHQNYMHIPTVNL